MAIKKRLKASVEFSAASISDLVFLLLIYFMVTSNFVKSSAVKIDFPRGEAPPGDQSKAEITITADTTYFWGEEEMAPGKTQMEKESAIFARIDEYYTSPDTTKRTLLTLKLDKKVEIQFATPIMAKVASHNGSVAFKTEK